MIYKCKICGGDIELSNDKGIGTCLYCGSTMTFPKITDEQRISSFNRGNHFRRLGDFDEALTVYEQIIKEDESDAEAHWCAALCRYGIEYVEDPATMEYIPTCHRASFDNFTEDIDYQAAIKYSDGVTQRQYQKDGKKIEDVAELISICMASEGDCVKYGRYQQSDITGQTKEPVEWYVIRHNEDKALLLSKDIIEYATGHNGNTQRTFINAYDCLNESFYANAFNDFEKNYISMMERSIPVDGTVECHAFIPAEDEIEGLSEQILIGYTTDYASEKGAFRGTKENDKVGIWITAINDMDYTESRNRAICYFVSTDGIIDLSERKDVGIRPAIWVNYKANVSSENDVVQ